MFHFIPESLDILRAVDRDVFGLYADLKEKMVIRLNIIISAAAAGTTVLATVCCLK